MAKASKKVEVVAPIVRKKSARKEMEIYTCDLVSLRYQKARAKRQAALSN